MKKLLSISVLAACSLNLYAANTEPAFVDSIESRTTGYHGVYLSKAIPSQQCTLGDRAVVVENDPGGKSQLSVLLAALASGKKVIVGVSECASLGTVSGATAPKIVKVHLFRE